MQWTHLVGGSTGREPTIAWSTVRDVGCSFLRAIAVASVLAGCVVEVDASSAATSSSESAIGQPDDRLDHRDAVLGATELGATEEDCHGNALPSCDAGWTGPSCELACDPGAGECGTRYYCHGDGRVAGLALSRAHLFELEPGVAPLELRDQLEGWIAAHADVLGLADGLTAEDLQLEPADGFEVKQGLLRLYRFRQTYPASESDPQVPVVGEGALLSLQADPTGAVALTGTVIDPRVPYAHSRWQASASQAGDSIRQHASLRTGVPEDEIEVEALQLVGAPWAEQIGWYGVPTARFMSMGRVIVDADPKATGTLELLMYDDGNAYALGDVTQITVQTQDVMQDPWLHPMVEQVEGSLVNGDPLLGSIVDGYGQAQLGTEEVVVIDVHGNELGSNGLYDQATSTWDFERYMEATGQFTADATEDQFAAQRLYHLVHSGYAVIDRVASGSWDSAIWLDDPTQQSDFAPGTYQPRILIGYNHASTGASGKASWVRPTLEAEVVLGFPEVVQQPAPNLQNEVVATIEVPLGLIDADTLFHEVGHNLDVFLAPGYPDNHAPPSCPGCPSCAEDTSDEANPLTETIAQMLGMWQLVRVFPDMPHDTCSLMNHLKGGTTNNQQKVHSPGCMSSSDSIGLFVRDDDPACPDPSLCDKPSNDETDPAMGASHWCDATEGYNTYSILQAWWNSLHGLYCAPPGPMGVICVPQTVIWPPGCDQPGSSLACATPDEVAGHALLYAIRSNPTSYDELFDDMATFVSCNYGTQAYDDFNQALCDHQIRACDEPAPILCEQCGNGIREGSEQCDGYDLSVNELGQVATCASVGYEDGTLGCQGIMDAQPCSYDFSQCTTPGLDDTGASMGSSTSPASDGLETDDGTESSGIDGGGDGCGCTSGGAGDGRGMLSLMLLSMLFAVRRHRPSTMRTRAAQAALSTAVGAAAACAERPMAAEEAGAEARTATSPSDTNEASGDDTSTATAGWPQDWYGDYYEDPGVDLGRAYPGQHVDFTGFWNMRLEHDVVTLEQFNTAVDDVPREWTFATELDDDVLHVQPPGGEWEILYPGADDVLLRPGAGCDEIVLEVHTREPPYAPFHSTMWRRGRVCLVDPYDEAVFDDTWVIDHCPDAVSRCGAG